VLPDYLRTVVQILDRGLKTNSYKVALLRALGDYSEQDQVSEQISFEWLAERFMSYYWPLAVTFRVRQATDPTRDPVIKRFIRQEVANLGLAPSCNLQDYRRKHADSYCELL
jgi:hypothetical protein